MKCDHIHPLMMDFLYDEISDESKKQLQMHLEKCEKCRQELASLKNTSQILQHWEEIEPDFNLMIMPKKASAWKDIKHTLRNLIPKPKKIGYGLAYGIIGMMLILALANTEISYQQGNFSIRMALFSKPSPQVPGEIVNAQVQQLMEKMQRENYYLMKALIQQSEEQQRMEWQAALVQLNKNFEQQRLRDLSLVGAGLEEFERNTYKQIKRTENSFNELFRLINSPQR